MNISVNRKEFLAAAMHAARCVTKKAALPILEHVMISGLDNYVTLRAFNYNKSQMVRVMDVWRVYETGQCTVCPTKLCRVLKSMSDKFVSIRDDLKEGFVTICGASTTTRLEAGNPNEMPAALELGTNECDYIDLQCGTLAGLLTAVKQSICTDPARFNITQVLLDFSTPGELTAVTTDGRRMAKKTAKIPVQSYFNDKLMIPEATVNELIAIDPDDLYLSDLWMMFIQRDDHQSGASYTAMAIRREPDINFPNYNVVLATDPTHEATFNRAHLLAAMKRSLVMTNSKFCSVRMNINGKCTLTTITPSVGEHQEVIDVVHTSKGAEGGGAVVAINPKFVIDVLNASKEDQVTFELSDSQKPVRVVSGNCTHVVMPIRM